MERGRVEGVRKRGRKGEGLKGREVFCASESCKIECIDGGLCLG